MKVASTKVTNPEWKAPLDKSIFSSLLAKNAPRYQKQGLIVPCCVVLNNGLSGHYAIEISHRYKVTQTYRDIHLCGQ
jgi:hypothetical protein